MTAIDRPPRIAVPHVPEPPPPRRFPLVATLAPVAVSGALFAITRSPFTLMFALMGPIIGIATMADAALQRRRGRRRDSVRLAEEFAAANAQIDREHDAERARLDARHPRAADLVDEHGALAWHPLERDGRVRIGTGDRPSDLDVTDGNSSDDRVRALRLRGSVLERAPVAVDYQHGIAIVGNTVQAISAARSAVLLLAAVLDPSDYSLTAPADPEWDWAAALPHELSREAASGLVRFVGAKESVQIEFAGSRGALSVRGSAVLTLRPDGSATLGSETSSFEPELMSLESALVIAQAIGLAAAANRGRGLPDSVALADLDQIVGAHGLTATIGFDRSGPVHLDLVGDGPHAIVGGTTGSGKSELLVSWVLGIAAERAPTEVSFLFVDFKGGAAFDPLTRLPHSVGVITDLDPDATLRALASLGAELRYRERMLAKRGLKSLEGGADAPPFPRLVIVVDEYAALVEAHGELSGLFADIAARGRSLGVHLVLCTQRPAGVVRDSILANAPLRISLRVLAGADSVAVIGTDAAAALPARPAGRALVSLAGEVPRALQIAHSTPADVAGVVDRWAGATRPRAPWLPPLPKVIPRRVLPDGVADESLAFGIADLPDLQAQRPAAYRPRENGSLLVIGGVRSGKTGVLRALAAARTAVSVAWLPRELPQLWDALHEARTDPWAGDRLLLIDDLDAIVASCDENYRTALLDLFAELLRDVPGTRLAISVQRISGALQPLVGLCGASLLLRLPTKQEHVLAGGSSVDYNEALPPGGGHWRGARVQVFSSDDVLPAEVSPGFAPIDLAVAPLTVVSSRPDALARQLAALAPSRSVRVLTASRLDGDVDEIAGAPAILVGDPETWQAQWALLGGALRSSDLLFDGCSLAELRAISRSRDLPPPFARGERPMWLRTRDGELVRTRLAAPPTASR